MKTIVKISQKATSKENISLILRTVTTLVGVFSVAALDSWDVNIVGAITFILLLLIEGATKQRWTIFLLFALNTLVAMVMSHYLLEDPERAQLQLSKTLASIAILNWYGAKVPWHVFRGYFLNKGVLWEFGSFMDRGIFQGEVIMNSIQKRFQAAWLRIGKKSRRPRNMSRAIAGGLAVSLERAHNIEDALKMRVAPKTSCPQCITVDNCSLGFNGNNNILSNISFKLTEGDWLLVMRPFRFRKNQSIKDDLRHRKTMRRLCFFR